MNKWFEAVLPDYHLSLPAIESNDVYVEIFQWTRLVVIIQLKINKNNKTRQDKERPTLVKIFFIACFRPYI